MSSRRDSLSSCSSLLHSLLWLLVVAGMIGIVAVSASAQTWNLTWSDEFNGAANSPINPLNWQYDTGILNVNNEAEYYCDPTISPPVAPCTATPNAYIDGSGHLVIQAIQVGSSVQPYSGSWTSARLNTANNLQSFSYGRIESSMALPIGPGLWPAFWALGTNITTVSWPAAGEMDFMENVPASAGLGPTVIKSTLHGGTSSNSCYCGGNGLGQSYTFTSGDVTGFHTYGAIWSPNMVQFYVDDPSNVFFVRTASDVPSGFTWDFNHPFFLLLNLAVGGTGSWPGAPDSTTPNPAIMLVDYVRAYQPLQVAGPTMSGTAVTVTAGQTGNSTVSLSSASGTGRVYLSCTTTAPKATCTVQSSDTLNPYTVDFSNAASASATVSVKTTADTSVRALGPTMGILGAALAAFVLIPFSGRRARGAAMLFFLVVSLGLIVSCGGSGSSGGGGGGGGGNGTTPGNYTVTVSAYTVSNASGTPDSAANLSLTVN